MSTKSDKFVSIIAVILAFLLLAGLFAIAIFVPLADYAFADTVTVPPLGSYIDYLAIDSVVNGTSIYYIASGNENYSCLSFTGYGPSFFAIVSNSTPGPNVPATVLRFSYFGSQWYDLWIHETLSLDMDYFHTTGRYYTGGSVAPYDLNYVQGNTQCNYHYSVNIPDDFIDLSYYLIDNVSYTVEFRTINLSTPTGSHIQLWMYYYFNVWFSAIGYESFSVNFSNRFLVEDYFAYSSGQSNTLQAYLPFFTYPIDYVNPGNSNSVVLRNSAYMTDNSYDIGYQDGLSYANNNVNTSSASYSAGYTAGTLDAGDYTFFSLISAVIDVPIQAFRSLFNFDLLGVNMLTFVQSLFTLLVLIAVAKIVIGFFL